LQVLFDKIYEKGVTFMPSNKPKLMTYTSNETIKKFQYIASIQKRSASKELEYIIEEHIRNFELKHGELIIEEDGNIHPKPRPGKSSISKSG
jgi:succinylglutamate desuccinylase